MLIAAGLYACKKDNNNKVLPITEPEISKISRTIVQAGDTLSIYGDHLSQTDCITEVFIQGRPCAILKADNDSIQVIVGPQTSTGQVRVTVGLQQMFRSAEGPVITLRGTPVIKSFWPLYGAPGDTIALITEHFSADNTENNIFLLDTKLRITGNNGHDTLFVAVPTANGFGTFSWQTYNGPLYKKQDTFAIRQHSYPVQTLMEWIQLDPAFSYVDTMLRGFDDLATNAYLFQHYYDTTLNYINSDTRTYTMFLPANGYYYAHHITLAAYVKQVKDKSYLFYPPQLSAIIPGLQLSLAMLQEGDLFKSASTQDIAFPGGDPALGNQVQITKENGKIYAYVVGIDGSTGQRVEILREHRIGSATILETDGELGSLPL